MYVSSALYSSSKTKAHLSAPKIIRIFATFSTDFKCAKLYHVAQAATIGTTSPQTERITTGCVNSFSEVFDKN
jgi:hypothetical protein